MKDFDLRIAAISAVAACALIVAGCGSTRTKGETRAKWQVVRSPGSTLCAAVVEEYRGDADHAEQLGVYNTQQEALAALARFKATRDTMTASGRPVCE
jgi:hypothetical protein